MFADLHLHTSFSDGSYIPEEVIKRSVRVGLSCIAITDHDSIDGIDVGLRAAEKENIEVLPGIELTAEYELMEIHILGYLIDYKNPKLSEKLEVLKKIRVERIYKIIDKLKSIGVNLSPETVFEVAKGGSVGRLHVARAMVKEGIVGSTAEAFQKYIGDKGPGYVLGFRLSPAEAIKLIKEIGGIPVLAHPYMISDDQVLMKIIECGIMGLEVYYPEHSQSVINFYTDIAKKHNLLVTGGSDCHGIAKPEIRIGSIKIPYELVEKLKKSKKEIYG